MRMYCTVLLKETKEKEQKEGSKAGVEGKATEVLEMVSPPKGNTHLSPDNRNENATTSDVAARRK